MLTKETVVDRIEVLEHGAIQVRHATYIVEDGQRIAGPEYHRCVVEKGDDVSQAPPLLQRVAAAVWSEA
jgi:hypothetical protein